MNATPLPGSAHDAADRGLQPLVRVGDDELDPTQAALNEALEERAPEGLGLARTDVQAHHFGSHRASAMGARSRLPSVFTATAIMAATETMRPPSRCLR